MGRHAAPGGEGTQPEVTGGRRRADERRTAPAPVDDVAGEPRTDVRLPSTGLDPGPASDASLTLPRTSRAERRREGLLPAGEDPLIRRTPARPAGGPPPGAGRRRTDIDPTAAPGRPPVTGERRRSASASPLPSPSPMSPAVQRPTPVVLPPVVPAAVVHAPAGPAAGSLLSGPLTSAAPAAATGRPVPPSARVDADAPAFRWDDGPRTTGLPSWAADPGPPAPTQDLPQRVAEPAPAGPAWSAEPGRTAAPATPPAARPAGRPVAAPRVAPRRPAPGVERPAPGVERPAPGVERLAPGAEPPSPAVEPPASQATPEPVRKAAEVPVGGRAAARLERQAAEAARKKSGRRSAPPARVESSAPSGPGRDSALADAPRRAPRRIVQGLVAVVLVAVAVLGFWSYTAPGTQPTSAQTPATSSAPAVGSTAAPAPAPIAPPAEVTAPPAGPVRAPITVLNSTSITGLAADLGDQFSGGGWTVAGTGESPVTDVATTTVYFTQGDATQQQAAEQLVDQFPDVSGPVPRYFDLPDQPTPGLVVVATGNWRP